MIKMFQIKKINAFEDDRDLDEVKLVNINELLTEKYHGFVADAETKNVSLEIHVPEEEIQVTGRVCHGTGGCRTRHRPTHEPEL